MKWEELSVRKYYEILDILGEDMDDAIVANSRLIDCIWDVDSASMPIPKFNYYLNELAFLQEPYKPKKPKKEYKIGDYIFCPVLDVSKITTAQYVDFQELIKREDHKLLLNVLFIKKGEEYGQSDNSDFLWENLSLADYSDVQFFFLRLLETLTIDSLTSSQKILKKEYKKEKNPVRKAELIEQMIQIQKTLLAVSENGLTEFL